MNWGLDEGIFSMGDGGVACMPLQHNTIMERFPIQDKMTTTTVTPTPTTATLCSGGKTGISSNNNTNSNNNNDNNNNSSSNNNNGNGNSNSTSTSNGFNSKTKKVTKKIIKVKKVVTVKKVVASDKSKLGLEKEAKTTKEVDNGTSSVDNKVQNNKEEVEEGELGTLKWPTKAEVENGEFVPPEKPRRSEIEKGEIVGEKWRKGDVEKGEILTGKLRKADFARDEIEKGEFIPDRWHNKDEYCYGKSRGRYDTSRERTPPSGKYSNEDIYRRKEFSRSGSSQYGKSSSRWESGQDRNIRISSKIVDDEGSYKFEYSNGKNHGREYTSGNRLKRHGTDSDTSERKHYGEYGDYAGYKSRRLSEDGTRPILSEHYTRHSVERFYRNSSSSRISSLDKYSSRHHEPILSSKVVSDRHGRSPAHSERSPRDRSRYYDHRERSPIRRERSPYVRERSPYVRERSPHGHERSPYGGEKSPYGREKSPYDRGRYYDNRNRSPTYSERSPQERARYHDRRDRTPNYLDRSPHDRSKTNSYREVSRKGGTSEKRNSQYGNKGQQDDKLSQRDSNVRDLQLSTKESQDRGNLHNKLDEKNADCESREEEPSQIPSINGKESPQVDEPCPEELQSMEEDMDICDTPPHVSVVADSSTGKWFYLDYFGIERGPSKLCDLKALVDEGVLVSDHLIKHLDSDRWLTIENAVSPLVTSNFPSIVSDTVTMLVSPPEAPGNLLADTGDTGQSCAQSGEEASATLLQPLVCSNDNATVSESLEDLHIDERVGSLLDGFTVVPGKELETIGGISFS